MVVGAAGGDAEAVPGQRRGQRLGVLDDLLLVGLELGLEGLAEGDGLGGYDVHQRAALHAREDIAVDELVEVLIVGHDEPAAWATQ